MQKLQKSLNNVREIPWQHFNATQQRQNRLLDPRAQQHSYKVGGPGLCKRQHKKEQFLPRVRSPLERPIYSHSQLWPRVIWDPDSAWNPAPQSAEAVYEWCDPCTGQTTETQS